MRPQLAQPQQLGHHIELSVDIQQTGRHVCHRLPPPRRVVRVNQVGDRLLANQLTQSAPHMVRSGQRVQHDEIGRTTRVPFAPRYRPSPPGSGTARRPASGKKSAGRPPDNHDGTDTIASVGVPDDDPLIPLL
jgi:hypothetical protein